MNSRGAHYNSVYINIVNSESKMAISSAYDATIIGLFDLFEKVRLCDSEKCGFCRQLTEQVEGSGWETLPAIPTI